MNRNQKKRKRLVEEKFTGLGLDIKIAFQNRGWLGNLHSRLYQYFIEELILADKIAKSPVRLANRTSRLTDLREKLIPEAIELALKEKLEQ